MRKIWRAEAFFLFDRLMVLLLKGLQAIHQGFWLGLLDSRALDKVAERQYHAWAKYRDAEYNLSGLAGWETDILARYFGGCRCLLIGAAGGGRELVALARRGLQADGFDCAPALVESAQALLAREQISSRMLLAAPGDVPTEFGLYDGLIMGWGGYMHIAGAQHRIEFLRKFRTHVVSGGPLLLSFFTRRDDARNFRWIAAIAGLVRRLRLSAEAVDVGDTLSATFDHHFTRAELERELRAAGFQLLYYTEQPYGHAVARALPAAGE